MQSLRRRVVASGARVLADEQALLDPGLLKPFEPRSWFHDGQLSAWAAGGRFVLVLAGTQSGKTVFGPWWLLREIASTVKLDEPNEYLIAGPTFPLLSTKCIPEVERCWQGYGKYSSSTRTWTFSSSGLRRLGLGDCRHPVLVRFGYAAKSDSLESATYRGAWLDECGQDGFREGSFDAVMRRLSTTGGRVLLTTTPYTLGWLKDRLHDRAVHDPDISLVRFESLQNPSFQRSEWDRALSSGMPSWKFDLFYRAIFTRPAGAVFDIFEKWRHTCRREVGWRPGPEAEIVWGLDFGPVHTAAVALCREPGSYQWVVYGVYFPKQRMECRKHFERMVDKFRGVPHVCAGGSAQEDGWREAFGAAGLSVGVPPNARIHGREIQLQKIYSALKKGNLLVMNDLVGLIDELERYAYELDDQHSPTDKIADASRFHRIDALRCAMDVAVDESSAAYDEPEPFEIV